jgi:DNA-directed RNA polymerase specialized sigma24 family protein
MVPLGPESLISTPPKRVIHRLSSSEIGQIVAGYEAGIQVIELAERFEVNPTTVQKHVRRAGLPRRFQRVDSQRVEDVVQRYCAGQSVEAIAKAFGMAPTSVRRTLSKSGVSLRSRGRPRKLDESKN